MLLVKKHATIGQLEGKIVTAKTRLFMLATLLQVNI
jgi:hypothetical protein